MDKRISVKVDLSAGGNLQGVAKSAFDQVQRLKSSIGELKTQGSYLSTVGGISRQQDRIFTLGYQHQAAGSQLNLQFEQARGKSIGSKEHLEALQAEIQASRQLAINKQAEARAMNIAQYGKLGANVMTFTSGLEKSALAVGLMEASALGFVRAASPAAMQTFMGSAQRVAGEFGIMLIPAIVRVSGFLQGTADVLKTVNNTFGGVIGSVLKAVAIPAALVAIAGAATYAGKFILNLGQQAMGAAASLGMLSRSAGANTAGGFMQQFAGGPQASGGMGGMVAPLSGRQMAGRMIAGTAIATVGSMAGEAIGGTAGTTLSGAAQGAGIGTMILPGWGTAIGAAIGGLVGFTSSLLGAGKKIDASFNFQSQQGAVEQIDEMIQGEAVRDPMQQAHFEQEMRALESIRNEIAGSRRDVQWHADPP
jgi:hypothetical protein